MVFSGNGNKSRNSESQKAEARSQKAEGRATAASHQLPTSEHSALKTPHSKRRWLALAIAAAGALGLAHTGAAAVYYWDTNGATAGSGAATGTWGSSTFWSTDATGSSATTAYAGDNTSDLFFSAGTNGTTGIVTVSGTQNAHSITFDDPVAITLSGGTAINLGNATAGAGIFVTANAANTISTGIILNSAATAETFSNSGTGLLTIGAVTGAATTGTQTITVGSSNTGGISFGGIIGNGAGGGNVALLVNNSGAGITTLSAANTYTGGTTVNAGTLSLTGSLNSTGALAVGGGTFSYAPTVSSSTQTVAGLTVNAGASTINAASGNILALNAITHTVGGTVNFNNGTTGTITTTNTNTSNILGPWAIYGSGSSAAYATGTGSTPFTIAAYTYTGSGDNGSITTPATITDTTGNINYSYSGATSATVGVANASFNTLRVTGGNPTITPNTSMGLNGLLVTGSGSTVTVGALNVATPLYVGASGELDLTTTLSNQTVNVLGGVSTNIIGGTTGGVITLNGPGTFSFNTNGLSTNSNGITGNGSIVMNGTGVFQYTTKAGGTYNFTGGFTLNSGYVVNNSAGAFGTGNFTINGGVYLDYYGGSVTQSLGSGAGQIRIIGGVSGFGENSSTHGITVNIGNAGGTLQWGTANFNPSTLVLGASSGSTGTLTFQNGIDLNGAPRTVLTAGGTSTISGVLSNSNGTAAGLIKTGTSTLILSNANTFTGLTTISAGILDLTNATALKYSVLDANNSITGDGTDGLQTTQTTLTFGGLNGTKTLAALFTTTSGGYGSVTALTLNPATTDTANYSGVIANGATGMTLTKTGLGTQTLSGSNTYTGTTTVSAGTLAISGVGTLGATTAPLALGGGLLDLGGTSQTVGAVTITAAASGNTIQNGSLTGASYTASNTSGTAIVTANLLGSGTLTMSGAGGTLSLSGSNSYSGATAVSAGTLTIASGSTLGNTAVTVSGTGTLNLNNASAISQNTLQVGISSTAGPALNATVTNAISGSTVVNVNGGTLTCSAANNYTGGGTFRGSGTENLNAAGALGSGTITLWGTTLNAGTDLTGANAISNNFNILSNPALITGANNVAFSGSLFGQGGSLTNSLSTGGGGTITVSNNVYLTSTPGTPNSITFNIGTSNSNVILLSGTIYNDNTTNATTGNGLGLGSGTSSGTIRVSGNNNYSGTTTFGGSGVQAVQATNSNAFGTSTLVFNNSDLQAYGGTVTLANTMTASAAMIFNGANSLVLNGTLTNSGGNQTLTSSIGAGNGLTLGNVYLSEATGTGRTLTLAGTGNTTLGGVIANFNGSGTAGGLTITNTGITTLSGTNTYTGTTTLNNGVGTTVVGNASAFGAGALVTITGGGLMNATGASFSVNNAATGLGSSTYYLGGAGSSGGITFSNAVTQSAGNTYTVNGGNTLTFGAFNGNANTITLAASGGNVNFNGILSNATGLTVNSYGTITLNGANSYTGTTTLVSTVGQSGPGLPGKVIAIGTSPFGAAGNSITWNVNAGGNAQLEPIYFQADSSASPVSYSFSQGNNNSAVAYINLDTATSSAGYSRSFTIGNGTSSGMANHSGTEFIVQQGPSATSAMTFNETGNDYFAANGSLIPLLNTAGTYGVAMNIASASVTNTAGTAAIGMDGNTTGNVLAGALNNNGSGLMAINKTSTSTWTLTGAAGTMSGGITIGGGVLNVGNGTSGALGAGLNAVTFNGSGTINFNEVASSTQSMGVLTASAGDAVIQSTYANSGSSTLTFSNAATISVASNAAGATMNFVALSGTSNKIILTQNGGAATTTNAFVGGNAATAGNATVGYFFGGSNYAFYDTAGYVRGVSWTGTPDANTVTSAGGVSLSTLSLTTSKLLQLTGSATNSANTSVAGVQVNGAYNITMTAQLQPYGILKTGGGTSVISGGNFLSAGTGAEYIFRADTSSDVLDIQTPIYANGTNGLTTSGMGKVILDSSGSTVTYGYVTVGGGTLQLGGSNGTSGLGSNYAVQSGGVAGGTQTLGVYGTAKLDLYGNSISVKGVNVTTGATLDNSSATPVIVDVGNGGTGGVLGGTISNSGGGPLTIVQLSTGAITIGSSQGAPNGYSTANNTYSGGYYYKGSNNGAGSLNINSNTAFGAGTGTVWLGDVGTAAPYVTINNNYGTATTLTNNNAIVIQQDVNFSGSAPVNLGTGNVTLSGSRTIYNGTTGTQSPLTIGGSIRDGATSSSLTFDGGGTGYLLPSGTGWTQNPISPFNGTSSQLILNGNSTFTGGLTVNLGTVMTNASSGTPFGVGNINLNGAGSGANPIGNSTLVVNPLGSGNATITALTNASATLNYSGLSYIDLYNQSGGTLTVTLGSGSAQTLFTRSGKGQLVIDDQVALANLGGINQVKVASGSTVPTITNGMITPTVIGATSGTANGTFLTYNSSTGFVPVVYDISGTSFTSSTSNSKVAITGTTTLASSAAAYAVQVGGALTINSGVTLTVGDGSNPAGVILNNQGIAGGDATAKLAFGGSEGIISFVNGGPTISATITGTNGVTFNNANGASTLSLSQIPGWTGTTTVNSGTVKFTSAGFTMPGNLEGLGAVQFANASGTITLGQSAGTHYVPSITLNAATSNVVLAGAGSTNFVAAAGWSGSTIGSQLTVSSGNWYIPGNGNGGWGLTSFTVNGGFAQIESGRYWMGSGSTGSFTTTVSAGTLQFAANGPNESQVGAETKTYSISGTGLFDIALQSGQNPASFGGGANSETVTVNQTGGTFQQGLSMTINSSGNSNALSIGGANTITGAVSTYNLKGGTFREAGSVAAGATTSGSGSTNNFNFTGGTLTLGTYTAANLTSNDGVASGTGTLYQSGKDAVSNLAPGDLWTTNVVSYGTTAQYTGLFTGKSTITGNYQADASTNAANLVVNLSGPTAAGQFHDAGIGKYDFVSVSGTTKFNGAANLVLNALPGFVMKTTDTLNVLTSTGNVDATALANVARAGTLTVGTGDITFTVNYPNAAAGSVAVTVAGAAALNQWSAASGSNWSATGSWSGGTVPGSSNAYTARFVEAQAAGSYTVNLDANETVNGLAFDSTTRNYTISSSSGKSLTLDATGYTTSGTSLSGIPAAINNVSGTHAVSVPIALNSDLYINNGSASTDTITLGAISGSGRNVSVYGTGKLIVNGAQSYTGVLNLNNSTLGNAIWLNSGASLGTTAGTDGPSGIQFNGNGNTNTVMVNTGGTFAIPQPITVIPNNNGTYNNTNNPTPTAYIGQAGTVTSLGGGTATFSGNISLVGYSQLQVQPNDATGTYLFTGDVTNSVYALDTNGVISGISGAGGIIVNPSNITAVKFTGNIGAGSSVAPVNFAANAKGGQGSVWIGASGKTVNLYNLSMAPSNAGQGYSKLVLNGDVSAYAFYGSGANNAVPQVVGNASTGVNTLNLIGSQNMNFSGVLGGSGTNENNLALNVKPGAPFTMTLAGVNTFTGGLTIGNGAVNVTTVGSTSAAGTWTAGLTAITVPSTVGLVAGQSVTGTGIPASSYITQIASSTTFYINGTTTGTGATVTFGAGSAVGGSTNVITLGNTTSNESGKLIVNGAGQATTVVGIYTAGTGTANAIVGGASTVSTLAVAPSGTDTYSGLLGGTYTNENNLALTMSGTGTLVLTGANTYTGGTSIITGTLNITNGSVGGGASGTAVTTSGTGAFNVTTVNGLIGSSSLAVGSSTTAALSGSNSFSGATSVTGTLLLADANAVKNSAVTLSNGATVQLRNNSPTSFNTNGVVNLNPSASNQTIAFDVDNNGSNTGNTLTLANGISFLAPNTTATTATTQINITCGTGIDGYALNLPTVIFGNNQTGYGSGQNRIFVLYFNPTSANVSLGSVALSEYGGKALVGSLTLGGTSVGNTVTGVISSGANAIPVTKNGTGTWTLSGSNSYTGATTISAGTLNLTGSLAAGSTVGVGTAGTLTGTGTINGNATLTGSGSINFTTGGNIVGTLGVTGGNWNGVGSVTGLVTSSSGLFTIGSGANLTASTLNVSGGTIASTDSTSTITASVNYTSSSSSTFAGVIAGSGNTLTMNKASSVLTLSGSNTFTGLTTISGGALAVGTVSSTPAAAQPLGENAGLSITTGGQLTYTGMAATLGKAITIGSTAGAAETGTIYNNGSGLLTLSGTITKDGNKLVLNGGSNGITVTGQIGGTSANSDLVITGGSTTLTNQETYNGPTYVYGGGTLVNGYSTGALPTGTSLYLGEAAGNSSGTFDLAGNPQTITALYTQGTGTANIITNNGSANAVLTVSGGGAFAGKIQNGGTYTTGLALTGGTLTLSGSNTYTGNTSVSAGKLALTGAGSLASPVINVVSGAAFDVSGVTGGNYSLVSGQTIQGAGTILGAITLPASSTVNPGNSGTLTVSGQNLSTGGTFAWTLAAYSTTNPGTDFSQITVASGNLVLGGTSKLSVNFAGVGNPDSGLGSGFWNTNKTWEVIALTGTGANPSSTNFNSLLNATYTKGNFSTSVDGSGDILLNYILNNDSHLAFAPTTLTLNTFTTGTPSTNSTLTNTQTAGTSTTYSTSVTNGGVANDGLAVTDLAGGTLTAATPGNTSNFGLALVNNANGSLHSGTKNYAVTVTNSGNPSDSNATIAVTANVFQTASLTPGLSGTNLNLTNAASTDSGGQRAGVTISAPTSSSPNYTVNLSGTPSVGLATTSDVTATVASYSLAANRLNGNYSTTATVTATYTNSDLASTAITSPTWSLSDTVSNASGLGQTYNANIPAGQKYGTGTTGYNMTSGTSGGALNSKATFLDSQAAGTSGEIGMIFAVKNQPFMASDIVTVTGTDVYYVLEMTYDTHNFGTGNFTATPFLGYEIGSNSGLWTNAALSGSSTLHFDAGAYVSSTYGTGEFQAGHYGYTTPDGSGQGLAWAVVEGNNSFAVIPEPTSLGLLGLGALGLLARKRRKVVG